MYIYSAGDGLYLPSQLKTQYEILTRNDKMKPHTYFLCVIFTPQSQYLYFRNVIATTLPQPQQLLRE